MGQSRQAMLAADERFYRSYDPGRWEHEQLVKRLDRQNDLLERLIEVLAGGGNAGGRLMEGTASTGADNPDASSAATDRNQTMITEINSEIQVYASLLEWSRTALNTPSLFTINGSGRRSTGWTL